MRIVTLIIAACLTVMVWSQQVPVSKPSVTDLVAKLHSRHLSERIDALDEIASDQALVHSRNIQAIIMDLLNQESEAFREDKSFNTVAAASAEDSGEEENSQYLASLSIVVNMFVDWKDPRQACTMVYSRRHHLSVVCPGVRRSGESRDAVPSKKIQKQVRDLPGCCQPNAGRGHRKSAGHPGCRNG